MLEKVLADRQAKLQKIRALGIDPYGGRYDTAEPIAGILSRYGEGGHDIKGDAAGRLILIRDMGKMIFAHLRDSSASMQIALRKGAIDDKSWELAKLLDLGDIVAVAGPVERTRTGEVTIWAERLTLLCKSLAPMPEKFHGLQDTEIRYRRRYLDLMSSDESMAVFVKRVKIIDAFREILNRRGFLEVETPVLQPIYGGAAARPFTTHHNTLDCDLFLRISPELYLKRLLTGGMERVYEFSRNFRNEGIDTRHNPEFTLLEVYQAYGDYEVMMELTEELIISGTKYMLSRYESNVTDRLQSSLDFRLEISHLVNLQRENPLKQSDADINEIIDKMYSKFQQGLKEASLIRESIEQQDYGKIQLPYGDRQIDYTPPWPRLKYADLFKKHAGVEMRDENVVRAKARSLGIEEGNKDLAVVVEDIFKAVVEPELAKMDRPLFVMDYPAEICPLTRRKADDPSLAMRFELYIAGMEIANAYSELNDPAVQEENFRRSLRGEGEAAAMHVMDEDFVLALCHGMPPAGGLGIGIDRVVMLLTGQTSIRDVMLFPLLRPQTNPG
jgi:lysyl-tRNA synthetase, class II